MRIALTWPVSTLLFCYSLAYLKSVYYPREKGLPGLLIWNLLWLALFGLLAAPFLSPVALAGFAGILAGLTLIKFTTGWLSPAHAPKHFLSVQLLLVPVLVVIWRVGLQSPTSPLWTTLYQRVLAGVGMRPDGLAQGLIHLTALVWLLWGSTALVRGLLKPLTQDQAEISSDELNRGKMIGNLERLLIYLFVQVHQPGLITLVVGLKALARFKKLEERHFAEYFLIGTLASLFLAALIAFAVAGAVP